MLNVEYRTSNQILIARIYLVLGRAGSRTYHRLLHMRLAVNSLALPVYKKIKISLLLCIYETIVVSFLVLQSFVEEERAYCRIDAI